MRVVKNFKVSFSFISAAVLLAISCVALVANAQETADECQFDPAPSDAPNVTVPCDDPRCNVGPCVVDDAETNAEAEMTPADQSESNVDQGNQRLPGEFEHRVPERVTDTSATGTPVPTPAEISAERRSTGAAGLGERVQTRIINLAANMSNRMEAAIGRFAQIISRLETRADKLQTAGADTTIAREHITAANAHLETATTLLSDIDIAVVEATSAPTPGAAWRDVKATYSEVKSALLNAHASLRAAVAALKNAAVAIETGAGVNDAVTADGAATNTPATTSDETVE